MARRGQKALPVGKEGLGGPPEGPRVIGRTLWRACRGWNGSGGLLGGLRGIGRPIRRAMRGRE